MAFVIGRDKAIENLGHYDIAWAQTGSPSQGEGAGSSPAGLDLTKMIPKQEPFTCSWSSIWFKMSEDPRSYIKWKTHQPHLST